MDKIIIKGARENNLKNINLELPKNKLIVMTGVSGSGKSSLAFDTICAEGERRYLESLVKTKIYSVEDAESNTGVSKTSIFFKLPTDLAFITLEQVTYDDDTLGCYNGSVASVYPVTQDEYEKVKNNAFRGPTKYKVIRLDPGNNLVELVSKYDIGEYLVRYLSKPNPIILETLPDDLTINGKNSWKECELNPILHDTILTRAVQLALQSKGISVDK